MRLPFSVAKFFVLWLATAAVPVSISHIFLSAQYDLLAFFTVGFFLLGWVVSSNTYLRRTLRPSKIRIGMFDALAIEDPSSHAFVTQGFFSGEPSLWITRGALSLLTPDEITNLLSGMLSASRGGGLRLETALTASLIFIAERLPVGLREIFFFQQKRTKALLIRESLSGVFWLSWILLLENFYFSRRTGRSSVTEEVLRKLEAESRRCVPRLPVALSSHSAVSPWPDAFLTLGRSCLLPERAVNLRA